jgi:hypothetical protein
MRSTSPTAHEGDLHNGNADGAASIILGNVDGRPASITSLDYK